MDNIANPSPVPETELNVPAAGSNENANNAVSLKDVVKNLTGRDYEDDEKAAQGIKDTFTAVTSRHETTNTMITAPENKVDETQMLRQELKATNFYLDHPEYKDVKGLISKLGADPEQVVKDAEFQKAYGALKTVSEPQQNKSVLTSNSRISLPQIDDRASDLKAMREGQLGVAEYMAKYKGVPMPS